MEKSLLFVVFFLLFFSLVSSEIFIDQDEIEEYNIGDEIFFSFEIKESLPVKDYVEVSLNCDDLDRVIFKQFVSFTAINHKNFSVPSLADLEGQCYIEVYFNEDIEKTEKALMKKWGIQ